MPVDDWQGRDDWSRLENSLWADMADQNMVNDPFAQALYEASFFEFGTSASETTFLRESLHNYLLQEYGLELDEIFDWEAWREAYGETA